MSYSKKELADYRLKRANETIEEAALLMQAEHWNAVINRLYYACFYAVSAYLVLEEIHASTHAGTKIQFNKTLIKTELLNLEHRDLYDDLFNFRNKADYKDFTEFTREQVTPLLPQSQTFIQAISQLINKIE